VADRAEVEIVLDTRQAEAQARDLLRRMQESERAQGSQAGGGSATSRVFGGASFPGRSIRRAGGVTRPGGKASSGAINQLIKDPRIRALLALGETLQAVNPVEIAQKRVMAFVAGARQLTGTERGGIPDIASTARAFSRPNARGIANVVNRSLYGALIALKVPDPFSVLAKIGLNPRELRRNIDNLTSTSEEFVEGQFLDKKLQVGRGQGFVALAEVIGLNNDDSGTVIKELAGGDLGRVFERARQRRVIEERRERERRNRRLEPLVKYGSKVYKEMIERFLGG